MSNNNLLSAEKSLFAWIEPLPIISPKTSKFSFSTFTGHITSRAPTRSMKKDFRHQRQRQN